VPSLAFIWAYVAAASNGALRRRDKEYEVKDSELRNQ